MGRVHGDSLLRACQGRSPVLSLSVHLSTTLLIKMVDNVETTTPTVEEVAAPASANGEAEAVTKEVAAENGANGTTHEESESKEAEVESTNGSSEVTEVTEETDEATKRKADAPSEDETAEKIAKLKESAAEVVAEAEQSLPEEPLTEEEATA